MATPREPTEPESLSVNELTLAIKSQIESTCAGVWVSGEISNFSKPQSGHGYFTLKDDRAQIRAVMWRSSLERIRFPLEDGLEVLCYGDVEVYAPRGQYQLVVQKMEPRGVGALELALRKLRDKLAAEGLFDPARKRRLPLFPRRVAIITSPTGAAIRDFLQMLQRRWSATDVLVVPVKVQGDGAAQEIAAAITGVNRLDSGVDCIVVARGGGSLEDLWSFNEEVVCRAIYASRIPVVSAVGHEIDVTLSDLVADVRALTPTDGAVHVVPDQAEVRELLRATQQRLTHALQSRARQARRHLDQLSERRVFRKPFDLVHDQSLRLDELATRATRGLRRLLTSARRQTDAHAVRFEALSPLRTLARGYSVTTFEGAVLRSTEEAKVGSAIETQLAHGRLTSRIEQIEPH